MEQRVSSCLNCSSSGYERSSLRAGSHFLRIGRKKRGEEKKWPEAKRKLPSLPFPLRSRPFFFSAFISSDPQKSEPARRLREIRATMSISCANWPWKSPCTEWALRRSSGSLFHAGTVCGKKERYIAVLVCHNIPETVLSYWSPGCASADK